jgi:hypothetical protein
MQKNTNFLLNLDGTEKCLFQNILQKYWPTLRLFINIKVNTNKYNRAETCLSIYIKRTEYEFTKEIFFWSNLFLRVSREYLIILAKLSKKPLVLDIMYENNFSSWKAILNPQLLTLHLIIL